MFAHFTAHQLQAGTRGKYAERYAAGTNIVKLDSRRGQGLPWVRGRERGAPGVDRHHALTGYGVGGV